MDDAEGIDGLGLLRGILSRPCFFCCRLFCLLLARALRGEGEGEV